MSPNLRREIKNIITNRDTIEVVFWNGSSFIACVSGESSRGIGFYFCPPCWKQYGNKFSELMEG